MEVPPAGHPTDQVLDAFGLGKLDERDADAVGQHLESCPICRRRVAEITSDTFLDRFRGARAGPHSPTPITVPLGGVPTVDVAPRSPSPAPAGTLSPGLANHPDYEVLRELGHGGMGVVYLARNRLMGRQEVLKVVGSHLVDHPDVMDRFLVEIRNAARLHHPNIVTAYSASRLGEGLVLAMEYVEGFDLSQMVKAKGALPVSNACYFVYQAALGLQHAHEHGMVHRDIKPSNLMLARQGNRAVVKVLDFGLAKATREAPADVTLTQEGQFLGTPGYIAPEQTLDPRRADIRADIYSLGCTLYHLLAGSPPFRGATVCEVLMAHHDREARSLNLVRPVVPVELATVVARMMAKDPKRRFQTPREVAQALKPFFKPAGERLEKSTAETATAVGPDAGRSAPQGFPESTQVATDFTPSAGQSAKKWAGSMSAGAASGRRVSAWLWPAAASAVLLLGLVIAWSIGLSRIRTDIPRDRPIGSQADRKTTGVRTADPRAEHKTPGDRTARPVAEQKVPGDRADGPLAEHESLDDHATGSLAAQSEKLPSHTTGWVPLFNGKDTSGWKTHPSEPRNWRVEDGILIGGGGPSASHLYSERSDYRDIHLLIEARFNAAGSGGVYFRSSFGNFLAAEGRDWPAGYEALINMTTGSEYNRTGTLDPGDPASGDVWRANSNPISIPPGRWVTLEVIADGNILVILVDGKTTAYHVDHKRRYRSGHIALQQHDPQTVIEFRKIEVRELHRAGTKDRREIRHLVGHGTRVSEVAFSPDDRTILSGANSEEVLIPGDGSKTRWEVGNGNTVRLRETDTGRPAGPPMKGHNNSISALAYSPDGRHAASTSHWWEDRFKVVLVWDLATGKRVHRFQYGTNQWQGVWDRAVAFSPDGRGVMAAYTNGTVYEWDLKTEQERLAIVLKGRKWGVNDLPTLAFSPDGRHLLSGNHHGVAEVWDLHDGRRLHAFPGHTGGVRKVRSSANGRLLLSADAGNTVRLWDVVAHERLQSFQGDDRDLKCIAISPDGRRALTGGNDTIVRLWDLASGREVCKLKGHSMGVICAAFSKDGRRAITGSDDGTIRLWALPEP